ncbi:MAG: DUF3791 domain-containing protein [Bacteroides sp.]
MGICMSERQQIIYMQARIIRLASEKWNMPVEKIAEIFEKYNVLRYIEDCFGIFHVEGDDAVFEDVAAYLKNKGAMESAGIN